MQYVRYVHLEKVNPIHKRQTNPLAKEDVYVYVNICLIIFLSRII
jgi:hypothetical protein